MSIDETKDKYKTPVLSGEGIMFGMGSVVMSPMIFDSAGMHDRFHDFKLWCTFFLVLSLSPITITCGAIFEILYLVSYPIRKCINFIRKRCSSP